MTTERARTRLEPAERRRQILKVAIDTFRDEPYSEVSLDDLAASAGVTRGLLHHYFGSKRALYLAVLEQATTVPAGVELIPPGVTGDLRAVAGACVERWLRAMEMSGGLWFELGHPGNVDADVAEVLNRGRDALVDRMIDELPFPEDVDPALLRTALRSYGGLVRVTSDEWLVSASITRAQAAALLETALIAIVEEIIPAMTAALAGAPSGAEAVDVAAVTPVAVNGGDVAVSGADVASIGAARAARSPSRAGQPRSRAKSTPKARPSLKAPEK